MRPTWIVIFVLASAVLCVGCSRLPSVSSETHGTADFLGAETRTPLADESKSYGCPLMNR